MRRLVFVFVWLAALAAQAPAAAQTARGEERLFTVHGLKIDVSARTATAARQIALANAQQEAFERLVDKLVEAEGQALVPPPDRTQLERMVRGLDIRDERSSATRYLATIDVAFWPQAIRDYLSQADVAYTESAGGPYLLLPLYSAGGVQQLFGNHPWTEALRASDLEDRLITYRWPPQTPAARAQLSPRRIAALDPADLAPLAERFGVSQVVVAEARLGFDFAMARPRADYRFFVGPAAGPAGEGSVIARDDEGTQALLQRAADAILDALDVAWKAETLVAEREVHTISAVAPVRHLEDWLAVRDRLAQVALVRRAEIERIGLPLSAFTIRYVGTLDQFRLALAQQRLTLEEGTEGYVLRPAEQASAAGGAARDAGRPGPTDGSR